VNELFYQNTADYAYATLFFAEYNDEARHIRYVNCGHLPAIVLHCDETLERLGSTSTVLGLFKEWDCSIAECRLQSGDALAFYSDGITESFNRAGEEFGEQRLIDGLRRYRDMPAAELLNAIVDEVRQFSPESQHDDITLIVGKCRS
jgi:serine phosphatase RsbU (regulator of sigma subunit)